jgi:hypothetical protein
MMCPVRPDRCDPTCESRDSLDGGLYIESDRHQMLILPLRRLIAPADRDIILFHV